VEIIVVLVVIGAIALFFIASYNRLVTLRQRVKEAWADIDVQLKRRHDLIPNLVETVKGYATHESTVFQKVTEARAAAVAAGATATPEQRAQAENVLTGALRSGCAGVQGSFREPHRDGGQDRFRAAFLQRERA
jgi:LemA protein